MRLTVYRIFSFVFSCLVFYKSVLLSASTYEWYVWWKNDRQPLVVTGYVDKVRELKGRDRGRQKVYVISNGERVRLDTVLSRREIVLFKSTSEQVEMKYYPTASGMHYAFYIKGLDSKRIYYSGKFQDSA